ncbi:MAG: homoserine O-succinyltransferase, partial [Aeromonas veronii]
MPIKIPDQLPAAEVLGQENIFVMTESRAVTQNIRPLRVLILNLMPKKIETEIQLMRMLSNSPLQVDVDLLRIDDRESKNTPQAHLENFYHDFEQVRGNNYDGMIITGAPLGLVEFEEVVYWPRIVEIIEWSHQHVTSTLFLCWAVQAALKALYGMEKQTHGEKLSGVYRHHRLDEHEPLLRGFDDEFVAPHSRYAAFDGDLIRAQTDLQIFAESEEAGVYLAATKDCRQVFVTG